MTATPITATKWQAREIGPRQLKAVNEAISRYNWEAKTITELTDHGQHDVTPMFTGPVNPQAGPMMEVIKEQFACTITGDNHKDIILAVLAAQAKLKETRIVKDCRTTSEERERRALARKEADEKEAVKNAHLATLTHHEYGLAETSRAVKTVLSTLYPHTKFSVRSDSYSGGSSIVASWIDGPLELQVRPVLSVFERTWFDGTDDSTHHIQVGEWNGHLFDFTGGSCRGSRSVSVELLIDCCKRFTRETELEAPVIHIRGYLERGTGPCGFHYFPPRVGEPDCIAISTTGTDTAADVVGQMSHHTSKEEPTIPYNVEHWQDEANPDGAVDAVVFRILLGEVKPPATSQAIISTDGITISENEERNGVELRFATKPHSAVLNTLKAAGWRWSRYSGCWYAKRTPEALAFAQSIAAQVA